MKSSRMSSKLFPLSCTKSCSNDSNACFFHGLSCTKLCSNACFFFAVCSAPNPAPMRAFSRCLSCTKSCSHACFFCGLSCTKSCSNACFYSRFIVRQIVLYGLNYVESSWKFVLLFLFYSCSENERSAVKPKTRGFVLFSSSELRPGSGRS